MAFVLEAGLKAAVLKQYEQNMAAYPRKLREVEDYLAFCEENHGLCLKFLYGHMHVNDLTSCSVRQIDSYVRASLEAWDALDHCKAIPQTVFLTWVLQHRVNNEFLDESRAQLFRALYPLVRGKTMEEAALAVNQWCFSRATYAPSDDRTRGPLAIMAATLGRCGEESVLAVSALRSVGIPARQVYVPRWSHCDDNHAWVEVWIHGQWRYLGACEPEPELDRGWFTSAASRAMLVHTKAWSCFADEKETARKTPLYALVNATDRYADCRLLTVRVLSGGSPAAKAPVSFQLCNYSELYSVFETETDENGCAEFRTGRGDLLVSVGGQLKKAAADQDALVFELTDRLPEPVELELTPPVGRWDLREPEEDPEFARRLRDCEARRTAYRQSFRLEKAGGNHREIQAFLEDARFSQEESSLLLSTLRDKDFTDIRCQTLCDALLAARPFRAHYPEDVYRDYVLAPRVADEMLLPERQKLRALFPAGFRSPEEILDWMREHLTVLPDHGVREYWLSAYGCLFYRQLPGYSFGYVFVSLCRAFGFAARLNPQTGAGEWLAEDWRSVEKEQTTDVLLSCRDGKKLWYGEHFSLGIWRSGGYETLRYPSLILEGRQRLTVPTGRYRLITTTRQIDGTVSMNLTYFHTDAVKEIALTLPEDQTARRLKDFDILSGLPHGAVRRCLEQTKGQKRLMIFAEPGSEPTEHLLRELLDCQAELRACRICMLLSRQADLENPTLRQVLTQLDGVETAVCREPEALAFLRKTMQIGDRRLPFVLAVDSRDRGVYAAANYNIRMAQTLLLIWQLMI